MSETKINQSNRWKIATGLLVVALCLSLFVALYQVEFNPPSVAAQPSFIDVSVSGARTKLGVNDPETFTATVNSDHSASLQYTWSITPSDNKTKLTPQNYECVLEFLEATEEAYSLSCQVKDLVYGNQGSGSIAVYDPYTSPSLYLGAYGAPYSYLIETDGLGWYRAINGQTGQVSFTSIDATTTINNALNNGDHVVLAIGEFPVSLLWLNSNNTLEGAGYGTHILGTAGTHNTIDVRNDAENVVIKNLRVSHDDSIALIGEDGINLGNTYNVIVDNVWVHNISEQGITASNGKNVKILNCFFTQIGLKTSEDLTPAPEAAVDIFLSEDVLISGNHFYNLDDHSIGVNGGTRVIICNNIMNNTGRVGYDSPDLIDAILIQTRDGTGSSQITVSGNIIDTVGRSGIRVNAPTEGNITISHNQIFNAKKSGISYAGNNGIITDNFISTTVLGGIVYLGNNGTISDNELFNIGTDGIYTSGNNNKISDNTLNIMGSHGISILTGSTNYIVSENIIISCGQVAASKDGINTLQIGGNIIGNIISDATGRMRYGIYLTSTSANVITMMNTISGAVANISNVGTNNVIKFNVGFVTEVSATITNTTATTFVLATNIAGDVDAAGNHGNILCSFDATTEAVKQTYIWSTTAGGVVTITIIPRSGESLPAIMTCKAEITYIP